MTNIGNIKTEQLFTGVDDMQEYGHLEVATFGKLYYKQASDELMMDDFYFLHFGGPLKYSRGVEAAKAVYRRLVTIALNFNDRIQKDPTIQHARTSDCYKVKSFGVMSANHMGEFKIEGFNFDSKEKNTEEETEIPQYVAALIAIAEFMQKEIKENIEKETAS